MNKRIFGAILVVLVALVIVPVEAKESLHQYPPRIQKALDEIDALEPTIRESQWMALEFFRIDPDTVDSMRTRAGWKSIVPTVAGRYRRQDNMVDLDKWDLINYPDRIAGRDYALLDMNEFEATASWDLSRLVFNPEVLDVTSLVVLQEAILKEITRIYYTRRRLQVDLILAPPKDAPTLLSKELRVEELTATMDAMTGGKFSMIIEEKMAHRKKMKTQNQNKNQLAK
jgi:hypothetical protein